MKDTLLHRLAALICMICVSTIMALAESVTKDKVTIQYEPMADGTIKVVNVWNRSDCRIDLKIDGRIVTVNVNSSAKPNQIAANYVRYDYATKAGQLLWKRTSQEAPAAVDETPAKEPDPIQKTESPVRTNHELSSTGPSERMKQKPGNRSSVGYLELLNQDEFFGIDAVTAYTQQVEALCSDIESSKNKSQFILDNDVELLLDNSEKEIAENRQNVTAIAEDIVANSNVDAASRESTTILIVETLNNRLKAREDAYNKLKDTVAEANNDNGILPHDLTDNILNYGIIAIIVLLLIVLTIVAVRRKKSKGNTSEAVSRTVAPHDAPSDSPAIVVRRRTTSILKKQCIDDVIDNPAYMMIDTSDFSNDSAVRKIYIKNTCIKDVYNLYEEDLRDSENPKEDGCMVLGRWVHDEADHTYDISLEEVVFPGDDAIFKEYELNFGGKIKLRIAEKLRKLRRETNLQYDLVCWIHSHPGLGVFFSNSDDSVQMQLKHTQHPNFLIAFVVDILTSDQELGIFTFRKDGSMNSKSDIMKMYSLEEMYKWALQSERSSFTPDNYFNILADAKLKLPACQGVELNNSSIIDVTRIVAEPETGIVGWAVGTTVATKSGQEFVVSGIVRSTEKPGAGVIGCLISMAHVSLPTIQRLISRDSANLSFVTVYSSKLMSLTTIPVSGGELLSDEQFYGDVNIDDLKIWTRRKR